MCRNLLMLSLITVCVFSLCSVVFAWDTNYDGSVMPNDQTLGSAAWTSSSSNDISRCSIQDNIFNLADLISDSTAYFYREKMLPKETPLTLEARVRVASGTGASAEDAPAIIDVGNISGCVFLGLWPDKIKCGTSEHLVDMTEFHVIRIALQADNSYLVWLDGAQVFSGSTADGTQAGITFGSSKSLSGNVDSYWDYVGYSKSYIPVQQ